MLDGQTNIAPCAWCGDAAEGEVTIAAARHAKDAMGQDVLREAPLRLLVCHRHRELNVQTPLKDPRKTRAEGVNQLSLLESERPRPAGPYET